MPAGTINISPYLGTILSDLPAVAFKDAAVELHPTMSAFEGILLRMDENLSEEEIVAYVSAEYASLKDNPDYRANFSAVMQMASTLSGHIHSALDSLRHTVHPEVLAMVEEVNQEAKEILTTENNTVVLDEPESEIADDLTPVEWDQEIDSVGSPTSILDFTSGAIGRTASLSTKDMELLNGYDFGFKPIRLHEEFVAEIQSKMGADSNIIRMLTKDAVFNEYCQMGFGEVARSAAYGASFRMVTDIKKQISEVERFASMTHNLPTDITVALYDNVAAYRQLNIGLGYSLMYMRHMCRNLLVLDGKMLNQDNFEKFCVDGRTKTDILTHTHVFYDAKKTSVPKLTSDEIIRYMDTAKSEYQRIQSETYINRAEIKRDATIRAMKRVFAKHVSTTDESRCPAGMSMHAFKHDSVFHAERIASKFELNGDNNLENLTYEFVLGTWYPNTLIATAQGLLSGEVMQLMKQNQVITDQELNFVDVNVSSKIILEFLLSQLCSVSY